MAEQGNRHSVESLRKEMGRLIDVLNEEPPVNSIILATSFLDSMLAVLLGNYFIESSTAQKILTQDRGALGTFSSKADLSYCLGLVPKWMYQNLRIIGEIRNTVAHRVDHFDFSHSEISSKCMTLTIPESDWAGFGNPPDQLPSIGAQCRFSYAVIITLFNLEFRALKVLRCSAMGDMIKEHGEPTV